MVGGGVLSLPYAFYKAGIVAGLIILLITAVSADFTGEQQASEAKRASHN
jgi:amino acid permease|tara:strand:- start:284 stop:433 length:150 start_codon:yes stop_codon:yes gene_type:complete